jgi:hypothetical protein
VITSVATKPGSGLTGSDAIETLTAFTGGGVGGPWAALVAELELLLPGG